MSRLFFPTCKIAYESTKSQKWSTQVQTSGSGMRRALTNQLYPEWTIKVKVNYLTDEEARALHGFVAKLKGALTPFYWLDAEDCQVKGLQLPMVSSGLYQPLMQMGDYVEPVSYVDNLSVYVDNVKQASSKYTLTAGGQIKFSTPPSASAVVRADYRYYWQVYLSGDGIEIEHEYDNINRTSSFKLVTVR